jgi:hypothetical protein
VWQGGHNHQSCIVPNGMVGSPGKTARQRPHWRDGTDEASGSEMGCGASAEDIAILQVDGTGQ